MYIWCLKSYKLLPIKHTSNNLELFNEINKNKLFKKLIYQLKKDFAMVGLALKIEEFQEPIALFQHLHKVISYIIEEKSDDLLNLLYRVDVSEKQITNILQNNFVNTKQQITFLILKREYQKVWYASNY